MNLYSAQRVRWFHTRWYYLGWRLASWSKLNLPRWMGRRWKWARAYGYGRIDARLASI